MTGFPISMGQAVEHDAALPEMADVVIIGGGVIGITAAWYLARKGQRVVVVEKGRVAAEQSARNWGWIRQTGRDRAELPIMVEALSRWRELAEETGEDIGLRTCGITFLGADETKLAAFEAWLPEARANGVDSRMMSRAELATMMPGAARGWAGALHTPSDMCAEPFVAVPALARGAVRAGVTIVECCAARGLDIAAGRVAGVVTEKGRIACNRVLVAAGAWSALFLRREGVKIPQLSVRSNVLATGPVADVHGDAAGESGMALRRRADGGYTLASSGFYEFWIGPDAFRALPQYRQLLMGDPFGPRYRLFAPEGYPDGWGTPRRWSLDEQSPFERMRILDPAPNERALADVLQRFEETFPALGKVPVARKWAGMIDTMPDVVPVVDEAAKLPGLFICTGMCGHGFGIGPGFGRIMADLMCGEAPGHDLGRFRLSRFADGSKLELGPDL